MALSNAEKQAAWRERRNALAREAEVLRQENADLKEENERLRNQRRESKLPNEDSSRVEIRKLKAWNADLRRDNEQLRNQIDGGDPAPVADWDDDEWIEAIADRWEKADRRWRKELMAALNDIACVADYMSVDDLWEHYMEVIEDRLDEIATENGYYELPEGVDADTVDRLLRERGYVTDEPERCYFCGMESNSDAHALLFKCGSRPDLVCSECIPTLGVAKSGFCLLCANYLDEVLTRGDCKEGVCRNCIDTATELIEERRQAKNPDP